MTLNALTRERLLRRSLSFLAVDGWGSPSKGVLGDIAPVAAVFVIVVKSFADIRVISQQMIYSAV